MLFLLKKYWKHLLVFIVAIFVFIGSYVYYDSNNITTENKEKLSKIEKEEPIKSKENNIDTVFVDIKGAVNSPGVYEIDADRRIIDVVSLAGGLTDNAYTKNLNLSKKVEDEMYIIIYTSKEIEDFVKENNKKELACVTTECICPDSNNNACNKSDKNVKSTNNKISINTGTKEELMTLTGIGEAKANNIIEYRNQNGSFVSIEDIVNVSGISDNIFNKIKDFITT